MNKSRLLLFFLFLFGLSIGVFDYYRDLWMSANGISTVTISHVKSISGVVTVLALFYFTLRVPVDKLKRGMNVVLVLKMVFQTFMILLYGSNNYFLIKLLMFFDIAFSQLILSSTYPLMMNFARDDVIYTKKGFAEAMSDKLGFLLVSLLVGRSIAGYEIDFNTCLMLALAFSFLSFIVLVSIDVNSNKENSAVDIKEAFSYFKEKRTLIFYLIVNAIGSIVWAIIVGMPMLTLTEKLNFESQTASFIILGLGIISSVLSIVVLKFLRFKNDHINLFFKFGGRVILYILAFMTGNEMFLLAAIVYLLITNSTHNFIFSSFFVNNIDEKYSLIMTTFKYCSSLLGDAIGVFICGAVFDLSISMMVAPAVVIEIVHYILASVLVVKKKTFTA